MGKVAAIILAAGASTRMGAQKMLLPWTGSQYMAAYTISKILDAGPSSYQIVASKQTLPSLDADFDNVVLNPHAHLGMTTSIQRGVEATGKDVDGYMICLADMPLISTKTYSQLLNEFEKAEADAIIQPIYQGKPGHPVIFSSVYYDDIIAHPDMEGCKEIVVKNKARRVMIEVDDPGVHADIDNPDTYKKLRASLL